MADPVAQLQDDEGALGDGSPAEGQDEEALAKRLDGLGESLAKKRSDAIAARESSGIEQQWLEDEEYYQGIDDANRNEHGNSWRTKPPGQYQTQVANTTRSTVFVNITRAYCDAAAARIADMLLPTDDRSWQIKPTPIPDLVDISQGKIPPQMQSQLANVAGNQGNVDQITAQLQQQALQILDEAKQKAEKAATRIEDWQIEGQFHSEVRKVIEDAARIGSGVLKGPVPVKRRAMALVDVDGAGKPVQQNLFQKLIGAAKSVFQGALKTVKALVVQEKIEPTSRRIDPWDFYPDGSCGENIHDGSYTWERDRLTPKQLKDLKELPGYIGTQIDKCLEEGAQKAVAQPKKEPDTKQEDANNDKRFEIWYFHGTVEQDDLSAAGCQCDEKDGAQKVQIPAMVTMVNSRVIKAALNPLDSGDYPYDIMPWQRKSGIPWGNGVARLGRTPQRIVNAGTRNMMDNGGLSAGVQIVLKQGMITPADGNMALTPRKIWYLGEDGDIDDVRKAMTFFSIPSMQKELMEIIQFGLKMMEDATGLPMLLQGQQGKAPETVGGMTLLNNNASSVLRRLARTFDDRITEPHIRRYYNWLLQYGEDNEKGDFTIDARGSSALVERDLQAQEITQMAKIVTDPRFGLDPRKWAQEFLKSRKFDAKNFEYDDDKWQKIVESMAQKRADPRVAVAQLIEQGKELQRRFDAQEGDKDRNLDLVLGQMKERIEEIKQSGAKEISFEDAKAMLAKAAMTLSTQREISAATLGTDIHKHHIPAAAAPKPAATPLAEPAGRAKPGQSFQQ